jgi:hypothetical protein
VVFLPEEDRDALVEKLKKEIAKLDWEEQLLRKRDDRLKWEQEMIQMEDGLKAKRDEVFLNGPSGQPASPGVPVQPEAQGEKPAVSGGDVDLDPGTTYLLLETMPERSVRLFQREVKAGMKGLYITRSNPNQVRKRFDLGGAKICWLTGVRASEDVLSISGLQELSILVSNAIDENTKSIIFLDGLEYLVSNNDFSIVLRLVQQIRDKVSTSESVLLIPLNKDALDSRQVTLLERECHTLK